MITKEGIFGIFETNTNNYGVLDWNKAAEHILNSLPGIEAGVIFSDGEFVPIKDEELMQTIAERLDRKEEKLDINISP